MSPGFIKGLLISTIVFGFETLLLAVLLFFRSYPRTLVVKYFVRSIVVIGVFSAALVLFRRGWLRDDHSLAFLFSGFLVVSMTIEMVLARSVRSVLSPEGNIRNNWQNIKMSKWQFLAMVTIACGWFLVTPAIVFIIVAPEVLPVYGWAILIAMLSLVGFVIALWYWNSNEKKFGPKRAPLQER